MPKGKARRRLKFKALGQRITNTPTVFNSGFNFRQFWDGRVLTLEDQVDALVNDSVEMGSNWKEIVAKLAADSKLQASFSAIYPQTGLTPATVRDARGLEVAGALGRRRRASKSGAGASCPLPHRVQHLDSRRGRG